MLYEIKNAKQFDKGTPIKWFSDDYFDLAVWFHKDGRIKSFQLCYDNFNDPHALTWKDEKGFVHDRIDDGETRDHHKMTPILVADGEFPKEKILTKFFESSREIDAGVADFIYQKILSS